jgi:hypothetical protein
MVNKGLVCQEECYSLAIQPGTRVLAGRGAYRMGKGHRWCAGLQQAMMYFNKGMALQEVQGRLVMALQQGLAVSIGLARAGGHM